MHIGFFKREEFYLPEDSARVPGEAAVRGDHAVAGDNDRDRVVADRASDRLS